MIYTPQMLIIYLFMLTPELSKLVIGTYCTTTLLSLHNVDTSTISWVLFWGLLFSLLSYLHVRVPC